MIKNIDIEEKKPMKESGANKTYLCCCSAQEFYECGGLGRESCPGSCMLKGKEVPDNAVESNIVGCYWIESVHL